MRNRLERERPGVPVELEVRLGRVQRGRFEAGVSSEQHTATTELFQGFDGWLEDVDWQMSTDYFFDVDGRNVRQTSRVSVDTFESNTSSVVFKKTFLSFTFTLGRSDAAIKLSVATEEPVPSTPKLVRVTWVRQKCRRTFAHEGMRFDFTIVRSGRSKAEFSEIRQFELEMECGRPAHGNATGAVVHNIRQLFRAGPVPVEAVAFVMANRTTLAREDETVKG